MGWKIDNKLTVDPQDNDFVLTEQSGNTTWTRIKNFLLGTETLATTAQTIIAQMQYNSLLNTK